MGGESTNMLLSAEITNWDEFQLLAETAKKNKIPLLYNDAILNPMAFETFSWKYKTIVISPPNSCF